MKNAYNHQELEFELTKVLEVAAERRAVLEKLKQAIINDDFINIKKYACLLCGLKETQ